MTEPQVNHVGHHLLAKLLLPMLQSTASEHGVATVSVLASAAMYESSYAGGIQMEYLQRQHQPLGGWSKPPAWFDPFEAYCQSKLANVLCPGHPRAVKRPQHFP